MKDKNTLIGLVLIGTIFTIFTVLNKPSQEELDTIREKELAIQEEKDVLAKEAKEKKEKTVALDTAKVEEQKVVKAPKVTESKLITLETEKYIVRFNTKGGQIAAVSLKDYRSFTNYTEEKEIPLALFKDGDASNGLVFDYQGKKINTSELYFNVVSHKGNAIVFEAEIAPGKTIQNQYILNKGAYDLDYTVKMKGFGGDVNPKNVGLKWDLAFRKSERLFSEQRRITTIGMEYVKDGFDYLSEMKSDNEKAEDAVKWVAYKQSYFSSILQPERPFRQAGTDFSVKVYEEGNPREWTNLKDFSSVLALDITSTEDASMSMNWFFGPNDFEVLKSYGAGYDDILNLGWGLFRWINIYAIQPLFNLLISNFALSAGLAILLLTLIIKLILMPIQWKMYTSSAKMRILKPEVDALNEKYPKKEDAMKKQMEMMTLYRESGASPMAGCVPMLIQMPILLAVFRFFPTSFELRQKSFLWATDLSSYDSIWNFGVNIWPYGDHVSLFTLLMAGTTLIYTAMNSSQMVQPQQPGMPNMKVMMYIFPVMMIFFFNNYAAGLSYYYFISTLITILLMFIIKKFIVDEEKLKVKMAAKKAEASQAGPKKKSKFQERLETMQKMQQEQMKNQKKK